MGRAINWEREREKRHTQLRSEYFPRLAEDAGDDWPDVLIALADRTIAGAPEAGEGIQLALAYYGIGQEKPAILRDLARERKTTQARIRALIGAGLRTMGQHYLRERTRSKPKAR